MKLVGFVKGFPDTVPVNSLVKDGFFCIGIVDKGAVGGNGITAGGCQPQLFYLPGRTDQGTAGTNYDSMSKAGRSFWSVNKVPSKSRNRIFFSIMYTPLLCKVKKINTASSYQVS